MDRKKCPNPSLQKNTPNLLKSLQMKEIKKAISYETASVMYLKKKTSIFLLCFHHRSFRHRCFHHDCFHHHNFHLNGCY